jgi:hypothetical protein
MKDQARAALEASGAKVRHQLDALGMIVADVPVEKLEELSLRAEISWKRRSSLQPRSRQSQNLRSLRQAHNQPNALPRLFSEARR